MRARELQDDLTGPDRSESWHSISKARCARFGALRRLLALVWISLFAAAAQAVDSRIICGETVTSASNTSIDPNAIWLDGNSLLWGWLESAPLGIVSSSETDPNSILNPSEIFGSSTSIYSMFNGTGYLGSTSASSIYSACNPYAQYPPMVYWGSYRVGFITMNPAAGADRIDPRELVAVLLKKAYGAAATSTTTSTTSSSTSSTTSATTTTTTTSVTTTTEPAVPDAVPNAWTSTLAYHVSGDYASSSVSVIDTSKRAVIGTLPVGTKPVGVAANATGTRAYVANYYSGTLSVIDTQSTLVSAFGPGPYPQAVVASPDGSRLYVANTRRIAVFSAADSTLITEVDTGSVARAIALNPSGTLLYVAGGYNSNTVSVIDTATYSVAATITVTDPVSLAVNPQGTLLYVSGGSSKSLSVIDTTSNAVLQTVFLGSVPSGIAVNADGTRVYVAVASSTSDTLTVIDTSTNTKIAGVAAGSSPNAVAITPDGREIYVAGADGVAVINAATNTVAANIVLPGSAPALAFVRLATGFIPRGRAALSAPVVSNAVTVSGINVAAPISANGGQYQVSTDGGSTWSDVASPPATVNNGDQVRVQLTSSSQFSTTTSADLTVGGITSTFYVTTLNSEESPDATLMSYTYHASLPLAAPIESDPIPIKGLSAGVSVPLRITGGEYSVSTDGFATWSGWSSANGSTFVRNNDWVKARGTTSNVPGRTVPVELRAGGQTWVLYLTTQPADLTSLAVTGPASANAGASSAYAASATWTYSATASLAKTAPAGTQVITSVKPAWSAGAASISADGILTTAVAATDTVVPITASYTYSGITKTAQYDVTVIGTGDVTTTTTATTTSTTTTAAATTTTSASTTTTSASATTTSAPTTTTAAPTTTTGESTTTTTTTGSTTTTGAGTTTTSTTGSSTTTTLAGGGTFEFGAGWNLVGNSASEAIDMTAAFGDTSKVTTVWKWVADTAKWAFYAPSLAAQQLSAYAASKGYDVLSSIAGGEGFWVNAKAAFSAPTASGTPVASTLFQTDAVSGQSKLVKGWNLIAIGDSKTPSQFNVAIGAAPPAAGQIPTNLTTLWAWDASLANWYFYAPSLEAKGGSFLVDYITSKNYLNFGDNTLGPTTGFWVNKP